VARTHGAGTLKPEYGDGGVVLGKGGVPIPTTPTRGIPTLNPHGQPTGPALVQPEGGVIHMDDGELVPPPPKPVPVEYVYRCDRTTWQRNMDGYQALHLLSVMLGPLSATLTHEEIMRLPADVRWHFRKVVKPAETEE
jgi:hypothetical protein